ncbi:hypothetical protein B4907_02730 [Yersinia kristensenii]|nr:hypothetical protein B4907_02730 [Yersinia kristensenii]
MNDAVIKMIKGANAPFIRCQVVNILADDYSTIIMKVPTQTTNIIEIPIKKYFIDHSPLEPPRQTESLSHCCESMALM